MMLKSIGLSDFFGRMVVLTLVALCPFRSSATAEVLMLSGGVPATAMIMSAGPKTAPSAPQIKITMQMNKRERSERAEEPAIEYYPLGCSLERQTRSDWMQYIVLPGLFLPAKPIY